MYSCYIHYDSGRTSKLTEIDKLDVDKIIYSKENTQIITQHSPNGDITVIDMSKVYLIEFLWEEKK
jgi:hypothetical protein